MTIPDHMFRPVQEKACDDRGIHAWESDLVLFRQKFGAANVTTLIERMFRFLVVLKNPEKRTKPIMAQIARALGPLPQKAC